MSLNQSWFPGSSILTKSTDIFVHYFAGFMTINQRLSKHEKHSREICQVASQPNIWRLFPPAGQMGIVSICLAMTPPPHCGLSKCMEPAMRLHPLRWTLVPYSLVVQDSLSKWENSSISFSQTVTVRKPSEKFQSFHSPRFLWTDRSFLYSKSKTKIPMEMIFRKLKLSRK